MERGTDSDRGRERERERERGERTGKRQGGHGSRGATGGEPGGAREDERTPDSSIPKWDAPNTEGKERMTMKRGKKEIGEQNGAE